MKLSKRTFFLSVAASILTLSMPVHAQSNMVKIVVPLTPGTTPDTMARIIAPHLEKALGQNVVVENRPGASGMIGMAHVAKADDDRTLLVVPATTTTMPHFYKNMEFDVLRTFTPITHLASSSFVLVAGPKLPVNTLAEFIAWAKANPQSFYASPGNGTHHHLFMEMLLQNIGAKLVHVPYKGSAPALNDVMAGEVPTMFLPIQVAAPLQDAGRLKIIGGSLKERHPDYPNIPSLHELGVTGFDADPWYAIWGSPKISPKKSRDYQAAIVTALQNAEVKEAMQKQGIILKTSTPEELQRMTEAESALWAKVIQTAGIKPE